MPALDRVFGDDLQFHGFLVRPALPGPERISPSIELPVSLHRFRGLRDVRAGQRLEPEAAEDQARQDDTYHARDDGRQSCQQSLIKRPFLDGRGSAFDRLGSGQAGRLLRHALQRPLGPNRLEGLHVEVMGLLQSSYLGIDHLPVEAVQRGEEDGHDPQEEYQVYDRAPRVVPLGGKKWKQGSCQDHEADECDRTQRAQTQAAVLFEGNQAERRPA